MYNSKPETNCKKPKFNEKRATSGQQLHSKLWHCNALAV